MKREKHFSAAVATLCLAVSLVGGCTRSERTGPTAVIVCLFDISGSTSALATRQAYVKWFDQILDTCSNGELIVCALICENTMARGPAVYELLPYKGTFDSPLLHKERMKRTLEQIRSAVKKVVLESAAAPRTDMMNAFQLAAKIFSSDECTGVEKILVVFSDMIEQSPQWDFTSIKLTPGRVKAMIETEKREGRLPRLTGVRVWVAGATAAPGGALPPRKIYEIEHFWLAYFKECGAELPPQHYGPSLIDFRRGK